MAPQVKLRRIDRWRKIAAVLSHSSTREVGGYNRGMAMDRAAQQVWLAQWQNAARALEEQRKLELRALGESEALAASDALLSLALLTPIAPARLTGSGLVHLQALLHRRRG